MTGAAASERLEEPVRTLTEFLLARIADDEQSARNAVVDDAHRRRTVWTEPFSGGLDTGDDVWAIGDSRISRYVERFDPARVLTDCDAKRQIMGLHCDGGEYPGGSSFCSTCTSSDGLDNPGWPCPTLRALALPYADHPDYREEWSEHDDYLHSEAGSNTLTPDQRWYLEHVKRPLAEGVEADRRGTICQAEETTGCSVHHREPRTDCVGCGRVLGPFWWKK